MTNFICWWKIKTSKGTVFGINGQLNIKIFICDQVLGILRCFDNFTESYSVRAQKGPPQ